MDFLLILLALIYWVAKSANKRSTAQKQQEAARARAEAAYAEAERESETTASQRPLIFPTRSTVQQPSAMQRSEPSLSTPQQRRHPLESSRATGHAHMETSMTGTTEVCPPAASAAPFEKTPLADRLAAYKAEKRRAERPAVTAKQDAPQVIDLAASTENAFRFDPARVREGLIYAEILGKPKALRR